MTWAARSRTPNCFSRALGKTSFLNLSFSWQNSAAETSVPYTRKMSRSLPTYKVSCMCLWTETVPGARSSRAKCRPRVCRSTARSYFEIRCGSSGEQNAAVDRDRVQVARGTKSVQQRRQVCAGRPMWAGPTLLDEALLASEVAPAERSRSRCLTCRGVHDQRI